MALSSLPTAPVVLQNIHILDPIAYEDTVGSVLVLDGDAYVLAREQLGETPDLSALSLPSSVTDRVRLNEIQTVDADGWVFGPGLVDLYSHSGEPGFEARETVKTLAASALAGGFTRMAILPDTQPALDNLGAIARLHQAFAGLDASPSVYFWGAITQDVGGSQMTEFAELAQGHAQYSSGGDMKVSPEASKGLHVVGLGDSRAIQDVMLVKRFLEYAHPLDLPIALYPHDAGLASGGVAREGMVATQLGLLPQPTIAETTALSTIIECVEATNTPVHIMRVSTARSVGLIQAAKERGLPITASTTWMHVLLNTYALSQYDPNLRVEPPLGNPEDQSALILALKAGILDAIAIDHTPYTYEEKTVPFALAPPGVIGLQCALPLLWQGLVAAGHFTALDLWRVLSTNPATCLGQTPPKTDTEWLLFNTHHEWIASSDALESLSDNMPWIDQSIQGQVIRTKNSLMF